MVENKYMNKSVIRWVGTAFLMCSLIFVGNELPLASSIMYALGLLGWFIIGILEDDRALLVFTTAFIVSITNDIVSLLL